MQIVLFWLLNPKSCIFGQRANRIIVPTKELYVSIGTFSTYYDVIYRNILHCTKTNKMREKYYNGDYWNKYCFLSKLFLPFFFFQLCLYSGDSNTGIVRYSKCQKQSGCQLSGMGTARLLFEIFTKSRFQMVPIWLFLKKKIGLLWESKYQTFQFLNN